MKLENMQEELIAMVAGKIEWKLDAIHAALREGYRLAFQTSTIPIEFKDGDVAFADNGIIAILSFNEDVTEEIKQEFSEEKVDEIRKIFAEEKDKALLLEVEKN